MYSPFKFLDSYTKADKDIFFGREREVKQLYQKIFEICTAGFQPVNGNRICVKTGWKPVVHRLIKFKTQ